MKPTKNGSSPSPMLLENGGDYLNSSFLSEVNLEQSPSNKHSYTVMVKPVISCRPVEEWIENGSAKVYVAVEQKSYRKVYPTSDDLTAKICLDSNEFAFDSEIEITPIIVAANDFTFDYNPIWHDNFYANLNNCVFDVKKGQILGYGSVKKAVINTIKSVSSIVSLMRMENDKNGPFQIDLSSDVIIIKLAPDVYDNLKNSQDVSGYNLNPLINAAIAYPAFAWVVQAVLNDQDQYSDKKWFFAIKQKVIEKEEEIYKTKCDFPSDQNVDKDDPQVIWHYTCEILDGLMVQAMRAPLEMAGK